MRPNLVSTYTTKRLVEAATSNNRDMLLESGLQCYSFFFFFAPVLALSPRQDHTFMLDTLFSFGHMQWQDSVGFLIAKGEQLHSFIHINVILKQHLYS